MDLRHSYHLTQIPDLSRAPNLESINLPNCKSLIQFPWHSLQYLEKLAHLNLNACKKLNNVPDRIKGFILVGGCPNPNISAYLVFLWLYSAPIWPSSIGLLNNLSELCISGCKYLTNIPSSMRELDSLKVLTLYSCLSLEMFPELPRNIEEIIFFRTAIKEVPSASVKDCSSLWSIKMTLCSMLESLPTSIFELRSLASLELSESPNLKHLPEISEPVQSLCELNLEETGIEQLPESIGNLVCIKKLNLRGCGNLRYLPLSIGNLLSLCELNLEETGIEHLPESIGNLLCLECLYLDFSNILEIPASIKRLPKLKSLSIEGLDNLVSLPVLPVSLQYLNAAECKSLKFVSLLIQGLGDNDEILEDSYEPFFFGNCLELDENAKLNIISWFQFSVLRMTTRFVPNEYKIYFSAKIGTCFPGFEIPKWFNHQCEGASVHINLPPQWHNSNFLGFAVCAVVREVESPIVSLGCTIDLINAEEDRNFCWKFDCELFQYKFDSNHVCMWYEYHNYRHCADALEAKFNFSCIFEGLSDQGKLYVQIERCGMRMLYREDLNKFRAQNLLLDQSAHVTDQPEPSTRGTFDSVSEEPRSTRTKHSNWLLLSQDIHNSKSF